MPEADRSEFQSDWSDFVASRFHAAYERHAPNFGYETRPESAVAWEDVPDKNKRLMRRTVASTLHRVGILCRSCGYVGKPDDCGCGGDMDHVNVYAVSEEL